MSLSIIKRKKLLIYGLIIEIYYRKIKKRLQNHDI